MEKGEEHLIHPVCPHCGRVLRSRATYQHNCPEDPANRDAIMGALADPARPGVARSTTQYRAISVMAGAPDITTLLKHFANWRAVCEYYGLAYSLSPCPHCGRVVADPAHPAMCNAHPDRRAIILEAMTDPARPDHAVGPSAYDARAQEIGAPSYDALRGTFGGWRRACKFFGLAYRDRRDKEAEAIAEVAAAVDEDRELQRELEVRGLAVCSVREIDGGRRVACMLR